MKFKIIFAAAALLATQAFAIAGVGVHYTPTVGTPLKKADRAPIEGTNGKLHLSHGDFDFIQGFGIKAWLDILPKIDIEATFNLQFASYNASLWTGDEEHGYNETPLSIELSGVPFGKATPKYVAMNADVSVTYPFTIPIPFFPLRPYIGAGLTMHLNTFIVNNQFVTNVYNRVKEEKLDGMPTDEQELAKELAKKVADVAKDEGLNKSIGFHLLAGARFKLPLIPIAAYANVKCYFGGDYDADIDPGHFAFEIGGGFAL